MYGADYEMYCVNIAKHVFLLFFQTADDCLTKCIDTLQYEPEHQPEGKLLSQAREELLILRDFVNNLTN
jgi:hypothetical protein